QQLLVPSPGRENGGPRREDNSLATDHLDVDLGNALVTSGSYPLYRGDLANAVFTRPAERLDQSPTVNADLRASEHMRDRRATSQRGRQGSLGVGEVDIRA